MTSGPRVLFAAVCALAVAGVYAAQPVLGQVGSDLGVPAGRLGWIVAAGQLGYLVGLAVLVPLGDRLDRRRLVAGHLVLTGVGLAVAATATRAWVLLAGLAVAGLFAVVVQTAVAYAAALSTPAERGRTIGVVTSGVVVGILGARVAAGALAAVWGWRGVYGVLAVLLVVLAGLVLRTLPADPRAGRPPYRRVVASLGGLFREPLFVSRGLIAFFLFASFGTLWSGLALPLAAAPWRLGTAAIGLFGLAGLAGALGAARAGRWADGGLANAVTGGALVLLAAAWLAIGQAPRALWPVAAGVLVLDFAVQVVHVSNQHLLTAAHPDRTSSVVGGYMLFYSLGSALGATATTSAYAAAGWGGSSVLGAGSAAAALAVWAASRRVVSRTGGRLRPRGAEAPRVHHRREEGRTHMKYLLLKHYRGGPPPTVGYPPMDRWTPEEVDAHLTYMADFAARLRETGEFVDERALAPDGAFVRYDGEGRPPVTDGPFAETKDLIAGWMIIDVESWDRAVELAGELSAAPGPGGRPLHEWLEVRPFLGWTLAASE